MSATTPPAVGDASRTDSVQMQKGFTWVADENNHSITIRRSPKAKRKEDSLFEMIRLGVLIHQLGLSINCILLLAMSHIMFPRLRPTTAGFFWLSHRDPQTGMYQPGPEDLKFVLLWIVLFTGIRAGTIDYVLLPWARSLGVHKKKQSLRFAEQAYLLLYYSFFWTGGLYLYVTSSYFADFSALWTNFPTASITGVMKFYYLGQLAYWIQAILVVHIEEKRKDHWQMLTHHIVTCTLILTSFGYYQTKVGHVILVIMDVVDMVFPVAKMLKYTGYQTACDIMFGVFVITWFVARHVVYLMVCWSIHADVPNVMPIGCYDLASGKRLTSDGGDKVWDNVMHAYSSENRPVCFNERIRFSFLGLLLFLQGITIVWFFMIIRVVIRVLSGQGADDSRSDDEEEEEEEVDSEKQVSGRRVAIKMPIEEEVGVEQLRFVKRSSPPVSRKKARASGISIPGHTDHKELLGRIGCDKPTGP